MKFRNVFSGPEEDPANGKPVSVGHSEVPRYSLDPQDTKITEEGVAALREANPVW